MATTIQVLWAGSALLLLSWIAFLGCFRHRMGKVQQAERVLREREAQASRSLREALAAKANAEDAVAVMTIWCTERFPASPAREAIRQHLHKLAFEHPGQLLPALRELPDLARQRAPSSPGSERHDLLYLPDLPIPLASYEQFQKMPAEQLRERVRVLRNAGHLPATLLSGEGIKCLRKADAIRLLLRFDPDRTARSAA